ncbi:hypothetical protein J1C56_02370 [Aminobacter anthyllidis]|uniref:Head-to-tail joining protein n=1 Tax=Aminobacter anthyllidis TaxID=1035067 RepID=A0A9X1D471_9HYPH|nr:portal protein [Aminobacter anthyllidis]MBT1154429.1 hypothetical protein [Aminobacter anthyllidis]
MTIDPANNGVVAEEEETVAAIYERLSSDRQNFLDRARENAKLTIPSLMPPDGYTSGQRLSTPFQSIGSHGVNTLTSKLLMTILPANSPMFRLSVTDQVVEELSASTAMRSGVEKKLNEIERSVMDEIEGLAIRAALVEALKQLIVSGNVLLYLPAKGNLKVFRLDRYVVQRDFEGNLLRVIIKETIAREALPASVQALLAPKGDLPSDTDKVDEKEVDLYTVFYRDGDRIHTYQSIRGLKLPKSNGSWKHDRSPVMPLRWSYLHDEDYGRAYVDEYIGDLSGVESLSKSIREGTAAAAKINPMVNPTGLTRAIDIARAENLEVISGRADDVTMLQFDKQADFATANTTLQDLIGRLTHAFMMNKSVQRQAERVTAEEIRAMVSDIDDVLGGVYSLLAQELQLPLVSRIMDRMVREKKIPNIESIKGADGKPVTKPKIVTGIEALGRGHDFNKYMTAINSIILPFKEELKGKLNIEDFVMRGLVSLSIDTDGLFLTEEQQAAEQAKVQQAQTGQATQQMMMDAVKGGVPAFAKAASERMLPSEPQGTPQ